MAPPFLIIAPGATGVIDDRRVGLIRIWDGPQLPSASLWIILRSQQTTLFAYCDFGKPHFQPNANVECHITWVTNVPVFGAGAKLSSFAYLQLPLLRIL
jgi:hypothetical protein